VNAVAAGISLAVNVPLNLLLIPGMGIAGAALASTVSYSVTAAVTLAVFLRVSGNRWFDTIVIKREDLIVYGGMFSRVATRFQSAIGRSPSK